MRTGCSSPTRISDGQTLQCCEGSSPDSSRNFFSHPGQIPCVNEVPVRAPMYFSRLCQTPFSSLTLVLHQEQNGRMAWSAESLRSAWLPLRSLARTTYETLHAITTWKTNRTAPMFSDVIHAMR